MKKLYFFILPIVFVLSCDDNNSITPNLPVEKPVLEHMPLAIGNYWIYEHYQIDTLGNEKHLDAIDSIIITSDTIINDNEYFILAGKNFSISNKWRIIDILRDSLGYLVNNKGEILFVENNFVDTFYNHKEINSEDTIYTLTYKMVEPDESIIVPAGNFITLNYQGTLNLYRAHTPSGKLKVYLDNYYVKDIGKILSSYYWKSSAHLYRNERRLVRYYINSQ